MATNFGNPLAAARKGAATFIVPISRAWFSQPICILNHTLSPQFLALAVTEALLSLLAISSAGILGLGGHTRDSQAFSFGATELIFSLVSVLCLAGVGLYFRGQRERWELVLFRVALATGSTAIVMSIIFYLLPSTYVGRGVLGLALTFTFLGVLFARAIFWRIVDKDVLKRRVLVLGAGKNARTISERMRRKSDRRGFKIVRYVSLSGDCKDVQTPLDKREIMLSNESLLSCVKRLKIDEIIVAADDRRVGFPHQELLDCKFSGIPISVLPEFYEREAGKLMLDVLDSGWFLHSEGFRKALLRDHIKRMIDLIGSACLLLLLWPLMLAATIAIVVESKRFRDILYCQYRSGQNGKPFKLMKFRSMNADAEVDGVARWAEKDDPRVTAVGRLLRKWRIDELPQLINVAKGDMSLVGPRPERPEFVDELALDIPFYKERLAVKPGITGWAQIRFPYGSSAEDSYEKLQYDLYYTKNYSVLLDFFIVLHTVEVVLFGKGAR